MGGGSQERLESAAKKSWHQGRGLARAPGLLAHALGGHARANSFSCSRFSSLGRFCDLITEHRYQDFGGGFRRPRAPDDLLPYMMVMFLFVNGPRGLYGQARWWWRRRSGLPYDEAEVMTLTLAAMGIRWDLLSEHDKADALGRKLWEEGAIEKWDYEQDVKLYGEKKAKKIKEVKENGDDGYDGGGADY
jgi:hypothetical protein